MGLGRHLRPEIAWSAPAWAGGQEVSATSSQRLGELPKLVGIGGRQAYCCLRGRVNAKVLPLPGSLCAQMRPP